MKLHFAETQVCLHFDDICLFSYFYFLFLILLYMFCQNQSMYFTVAIINVPSLSHSLHKEEIALLLLLPFESILVVCFLP